MLLGGEIMENNELNLEEQKNKIITDFKEENPELFESYESIHSVINQYAPITTVEISTKEIIYSGKPK